MILLLVVIILNVATYQMSKSNDSFEQELSVKTVKAVQVQEEKLITGVASHYDYVTETGWSSLGHRVCAVRHITAIERPGNLPIERYSMIRVTNTANGKYVDCKITDYGPEYEVFPDRVVDLSSYAFSLIEDQKRGLANVTIKQL